MTELIVQSIILLLTIILFVVKKPMLEGIVFCFISFFSSVYFVIVGQFNTSYIYIILSSLLGFLVLFNSVRRPPILPSSWYRRIENKRRVLIYMMAALLFGLLITFFDPVDFIEKLPHVRLDLINEKNFSVLLLMLFGILNISLMISVRKREKN